MHPGATGSRGRRTGERDDDFNATSASVRRPTVSGAAGLLMRSGDIVDVNSYVALLYSIVLGEGRRVVMSDLRAMAERLGHRSPRTLVATGNLLFDADKTAVNDLEATLEVAFAETFGRPVDIIIRSGHDWLRLAAANPFHSEGEEDGIRVHVRVMRQPLSDTVPADFARYCTDGERLAVVNGDLWVHFTGQASESKLLGALTKKRLGIGTFRNWNTVKGLAGMLRT